MTPFPLFSSPRTSCSSLSWTFSSTLSYIANYIVAGPISLVRFSSDTVYPTNDSSGWRMSGPGSSISSAQEKYAFVAISHVRIRSKRQMIYYRAGRRRGMPQAVCKNGQASIGSSICETGCWFWYLYVSDPRHFSVLQVDFHFSFLRNISRNLLLTSNIHIFGQFLLLQRRSLSTNII